MPPTLLTPPTRSSNETARLHHATWRRGVRVDLTTDLSDRLALKMQLLLNQVPAEDWPNTMADCERVAGGFLKSGPRRTTPLGME
jgi:hypothetical protein